MKAMIIGLISDTHGELSPRICGIFENVDYIVHAGDVGDPGIIAELSAIAPLTCVRGNSDRGLLLEKLPVVASLETSVGLLAVTHYQPRGLPPFTLEGLAESPAIVVFGHTHFPKVLIDENVVLINPGAALYGRGAPPTVAILTIDEDSKITTEYFNVLTGTVFPVSTSLRHGDKIRDH